MQQSLSRQIAEDVRTNRVIEIMAGAVALGLLAALFAAPLGVAEAVLWRVAYGTPMAEIDSIAWFAVTWGLCTALTASAYLTKNR